MCTDLESVYYRARKPLSHIKHTHTHTSHHITHTSHAKNRYSDLVLRSPLGRRDGNVYSAYFDRVGQKPGVEERSPDYEAHMKPLLTSML